MKNLLKKIPYFDRGSSLSQVLKDSNKALQDVTATNFQLVSNASGCNMLFRRLRGAVRDMNEKTRITPAGSPRFRFEWGHLGEGREFFYLQPWDDDGLLFECAQKGWIISRAHKIPQDSRFMRESIGWDVVNVFQSDDGSLLRLSSSRFGSDLLSYPLYEDAILQALPLEGHQ